MKLPSFNFAPAEGEEPPGILKVPGHFFFCEYVEVPAELEADDLDDFAEMSLGGLSPFPPEQLVWGFYKDPQCPWMLLYSATLESLARAGYRDLDTHRQVFPSFVSVLGLQFDRPTGFFFYDSESLTLVLHPGRPPEHNLSLDEAETDEKDDESEPQPALELPLIHSLPVTVPKMEEAGDEAEEDDDEAPLEPSREDIEPVRAQLYKLIPDQGGYNVEPAWLQESSHSFSKKDGGLQFEHVWDEKGTLPPGPEQSLDGQNELWRADIRDVGFKEQEKKNRKMERFLGLAGRVAGIAAAVLLSLELLVMLGGQWTKAMSAKISDNRPRENNIKAKRGLLTKIEQLSTNNLRPFAMLRVLNNHRTGGIYFKEIKAMDGNVINIKGEAANGGEVNNYKQALMSSGEVESCETSMKTSSGRTTFDLLATFPPVEPEPPAEPEPEPEPKPDSEPEPVPADVDRLPGFSLPPPPPPPPTAPPNTPPPGLPTTPPPASPN